MLVSARVAVRTLPCDHCRATAAAAVHPLRCHHLRATATAPACIIAPQAKDKALKDVEKAAKVRQPLAKKLQEDPNALDNMAKVDKILRQILLLRVSKLVGKGDPASGTMHAATLQLPKSLMLIK